MFVLVILLIAVFTATFWIGYRRVLRFKHLTRTRVITVVFSAMIILTIMTAAHRWGFFPQYIAARFTMGLYIMVAGFFLGFSTKQYRLKRKAGYLEYVCRSLWSDSLPKLISILLIAFGIYRTQVLLLGPFTGIGITSGLSLITFGLLGLTIQMVPEFRENGLLILDRFVYWKKVMGYHWHDEQTLQIEYLNIEDQITTFNTAIPPDDHLRLERILSQKMAEHEEERKQTLMDNGLSASA